ncbi:MHYT domain-containing protein [Methyloferula stellata]|uniref:MHYT domain-containing protein n=1 Tax=Methyloferula stellata TaxID=876270 RepID=UPI0003A6AA7C|nr:MHYT domain-containing protein [Methyloferula stellata]
MALSVVMAVQGGYVGLQLADGLRSATGASRRVLLAGSAITLAVGIWSMHFVGMLAASLPHDVDFLVLPTLISFLTCVIVVGIGVAAVSLPGSPWMRITIGAFGMGAGICLMHYIGMNAVHANAFLDYNFISIFFAFLIAVVTSGVALWMLNRTTRPLPIWLAAVVLGIAVSGMHYTAMAGTTFTLCDTPPTGGSPALSRDNLAIIVAIIAFSVSGGFLLSVVPDRGAGANSREDKARPASQPMFADGSKADESEFTDHGMPHVDGARYTPAAAGENSDSKRFANAIPVEKEGRARNLRVDDIRSVRANAHYTYISDGQQEFFCKLPISAVEANLDPQSFIRVHRSYIVSIEHVESIRRHGENGIVELSGALVQCDIPVARARLSVLQRRVADHIRAARSEPPSAVRE